MSMTGDREHFDTLRINEVNLNLIMMGQNFL